MANKIDDGGPAFPRPHSADGSGDYPVQHWATDGMTLRDYFAIHAPDLPEENIQNLMMKNPNSRLAVMVAWRYTFADAMIARRRPESTEWIQSSVYTRPSFKCDGNHAGPRCADPECWHR